MPVAGPPGGEAGVSAAVLRQAGITRSCKPPKDEARSSTTA
jgi:hypothetical protein